MDVPLNSQNSRVYGFEKVIVFACVTWKGDTKLIFVNNKGFKINSKTYKKYMEKELLPKVNCIMNNDTWIFIQNSVPSHRAIIV